MRFNPSLVVSVLALVVATGGTASAATVITTKMLKNNAVTSAKVKDGTLTLADFKAGEREKLRGPAGAPGTPGAAALASSTIVTGPTVSVAAGQVGSADAYCPSNAHATGGGFFSSVAQTGASLPVKNNSADTQGTGWRVVVNNTSSISVSIYAYAICS